MNNNKSINKYDFNIKNELNEEFFFKDLLIKCHEKRLLDDSYLEELYYERMLLLKKQLTYYTKDESSSIMVEVAETILQGIDFTIGIYLKTLDSIELMIDEIKSKKLPILLKLGEDLINEKTVESKMLLTKIQENKLKVNNYSYNDTIDYGIPLFFKTYEYFFLPHETTGSIDYQLSIDNMNYVGIEYIYNYLYTLNLENKFCSNFHIDVIEKLLNGYDNKSELLLINIFELVLINSIGLIICGKAPQLLNIDKTDRKIIKARLIKLSLNELQGQLLLYAKNCCDILNITSEELLTYIGKSTIKVSVLISESLKLDKLENVFISFPEGDNTNFIQYKDGEKLSDSMFRQLLKEIESSFSINEKIALLNNKIKCLKDLTDILDSECLLRDEYNLYFNTLSKMEIVLLSKYVADQSLDNEFEKEWYIEFNRYILMLEEKKQAEIKNFKERIQLY